MSKTMSITRNWGEPDEIHTTVELTDQEHNRIVELVKTEGLTSVEAYDKMMAEKKKKTK